MTFDFSSKPQKPTSQDKQILMQIENKRKQNLKRKKPKFLDEKKKGKKFVPGYLRGVQSRIGDQIKQDARLHQIKQAYNKSKDDKFQIILKDS